MPTAMNEPRSQSDAEQAPDSDEQLMLAFARGQSDAFALLFSRYKQPLYGFFRRRLAEPSQEQAEELTQETFLAIIRAAPNYEPTALFRTYLYAIGFRILLSHRRAASFRATFWGSADVDREAAQNNSIDAGLQLRQAFKKLEQIDREILMLREFEQLSYAEIAKVLDIPLNTVRSRLFRARSALHDILIAPAPQTSASCIAKFEEEL